MSKPQHISSECPFSNHNSPEEAPSGWKPPMGAVAQACPLPAEEPGLWMQPPGRGCALPSPGALGSGAAGAAVTARSPLLCSCPLPRAGPRYPLRSLSPREEESGRRSPARPRTPSLPGTGPALSAFNSLAAAARSQACVRGVPRPGLGSLSAEGRLWLSAASLGPSRDALACPAGSPEHVCQVPAWAGLVAQRPLSAGRAGFWEGQSAPAGRLSCLLCVLLPLLPPPWQGVSGTHGIFRKMGGAVPSLVKAAAPVKTYRSNGSQLRLQVNPPRSF